MSHTRSRYKVFGEPQHAAAQISPIVMPLNNAQEAATTLVELARTPLGNPSHLLSFVREIANEKMLLGNRTTEVD
jgi:hypothetical protein